MKRIKNSIVRNVRNTFRPIFKTKPFQGLHLLTGALTHLTPLPSQSPHPLLLPLLTHTSIDIKSQLEGILVGDTVSSQGSSGKKGGAVDEGKVGRRDKGVVLNLGLEVRNCGGRFDRVGGSGYEDLHGCFWYNTGCSKPGTRK